MGDKKMLKNVDIKKFVKAMDIDDEINDRHRPKEGYSSNYEFAKMFINNIDESLEPGVLAWIEGKKLPNISYRKYSISDIMRCRGSEDYVLTYKDDQSYIIIHKDRQDYLNAIRILSTYMFDSNLGEMMIHAPY
jgi:hypothetical protein